MLQRKLSALKYPQCENLNMQDEQEFRKIVIWLENNKIKSYPGNISNQLSNTNLPIWNEEYEKYKANLKCPSNLSREGELDFFAGVALMSAYSSEKEKFNRHALKNLKTLNIPNVQTDNPLDSIDFSSRQFSEGVKSLARVLKVSAHPDHLVTLEACRKVVEKHFCDNNLNLQGINKGTPFPYHNTDLGFDLGDVGLNHAAKILRLLYIQDLRNLQTSANEVIVSVQSVTANPKTDTKLGKVGM